MKSGSGIRRGVTCSGGVGDTFPHSSGSGRNGRSDVRHLFDLLPNVLNEGSAAGERIRGGGGSVKGGLSHQLSEMKQQAEANRLEKEALKV